MARKDGKTVETTEYAKMMVRMNRAYGRRVANADPEDLADMLNVIQAAQEAAGEAVYVQRVIWGRSWAEIGRGLGVSRQAAQQRFGGWKPPEGWKAPEPK